MFDPRLPTCLVGAKEVRTFPDRSFSRTMKEGEIYPRSLEPNDLFRLRLSGSEGGELGQRSERYSVSLNECLNLCNGDLSCRGLTYPENLVSKACVLKEKMAIGPADHRVQDFDRQTSMSFIKRYVSSQADSPGSDLTSIAQASPAECAELCDTRRECAGFVYSRTGNEGLCVFKSALENRTSSKNWTMYKKLQ